MKLSQKMVSSSPAQPLPSSNFLISNASQMELQLADEQRQTAISKVTVGESANQINQVP
jgi:hypothetical protein